MTSQKILAIIEKYYYPISAGIVFIFSLVTDLYYTLSYFLLGITVFMILYRLGKGILLRELIALHGVFICLVMPIVGYEVFNRDNALATLWVRFMPVSADTYFSFALPAMSAFVMSLCWPVQMKEVGDQGQGVYSIMYRIKAILEKRPSTGVYIICTGSIAFFLSKILPGALVFVATLVFWSSFAGVLYVYFTKKLRFRILILTLFVVFIVTNAIQSGMFTIIAYMGITLFSFFFLGKKIKFWKKIAFFGFGVLMLFLIQSVKQTYRQMTWSRYYEGSQLVLFGELLQKRLENPADLLDKDALFPIYSRANQGYNVAMVMRRIPAFQDYDNGTNLLRTLAASVVPRLLWPDKPEAGGKFNMLFYAGLRINKWSTNVGPLGEAYGSFGVTGGILYMFFLGAFIRWAYRWMFSLMRKTPLLLFWIPVLFYQVTSSMETDTLQIMNSMIKGAFFIFLVYKLLPWWFGKVKGKQQGKVSAGIYRQKGITV